MANRFPKLSSPAILAPMSGVTDVAFRTLAKKYGAGLTYTEFVSSSAVVNAKSLRSLQIDASEKPVAVQIYGSNAKEIIAAAKMLEERFDIIDLNCGCPAWKVIKTGAGSALLNNPEQIYKLINKLVSSISKPVTLKIRSGIDKSNINAVKVAKRAEDAGAAAITVHGRTQKQGYSGKADWNIIKKVKQSVNIPVIGNGDVSSPESFSQKLRQSDVDAIMIGRGAIGNPYIFKQINDYLKTGKYEIHNSIDDLKRYINLAKKYKISYSTIKRNAVAFIRNVKYASAMRDKLSKVKSLAELLRSVDAA